MTTTDALPNPFPAMQARIAEVNEAVGWNETRPTFLEAMMLLVTEVGEAAEAWRAWGTEDATAEYEWVNCKREIWCDIHQVFGVHADHHQPAKPEGVGSEFADILIRLLDDCTLFNIDLMVEYERKVEYNSTRPYRHGNKRL